MKPTEPLPLHHSWPIVEAGLRLDLGWVMDADAPSPFAGQDSDAIGRWACDLADQSLTWSPAAYDLFGLPRDAWLSRTDTVAFYADESRAAMERLRAYAIRHRRGFTLDARIRPARGDQRWMRLMTSPVCENGRVVRLEGLKLDVTSAYR